MDEPVNFHEVRETCLMSERPQMLLKLCKLTDLIPGLSNPVDHPHAEVHSLQKRLELLPGQVDLHGIPLMSDAIDA